MALAVVWFFATVMMATFSIASTAVTFGSKFTTRRPPDVVAMWAYFGAALLLRLAIPVGAIVVTARRRRWLPAAFFGLTLMLTADLLALVVGLGSLTRNGV